MKNAVMWFEYAKTAKKSIDTLNLMNGLLKKKVVNLSFSLQTCETEVINLRKMVNDDNTIIQARNEEVAHLKKVNKRQATFMKVFFPVLGGLVVGGVTYAIIK
jgi:hypothetical protein